MDCTAALGELIQRPKMQDTSGTMATERSLMATAIMLYARATSTNGDKGERGSIQLSEKKLTPEDWADHNALLDVRNQAMAHVYPSRRLSDHDWHRDIFFAVHLGGGVWKAASASKQTSFHAVTFARLERMLPVAHRELKAKFHERIGAVTDMINKEVKAELLQKHVFDPVAIFGSEESVQLVLGGAVRGEASYWVNEGDGRSH